MATTNQDNSCPDFPFSQPATGGGALKSANYGKQPNNPRISTAVPSSSTQQQGENGDQPSASLSPSRQSRLLEQSRTLSPGNERGRHHHSLGSPDRGGRSQAVWRGLLGRESSLEDNNLGDSSLKIFHSRDTEINKVVLSRSGSGGSSHDSASDALSEQGNFFNHEDLDTSDSGGKPSVAKNERHRKRDKKKVVEYVDNHFSLLLTGLEALKTQATQNQEKASNEMRQSQEKASNEMREVGKKLDELNKKTTEYRQDFHSLTVRVDNTLEILKNELSQVRTTTKKTDSELMQFKNVVAHNLEEHKTCLAEQTNGLKELSAKLDVHDRKIERLESRENVIAQKAAHIVLEQSHQRDHHLSREVEQLRNDFTKIQSAPPVKSSLIETVCPPCNSVRTVTNSNWSDTDIWDGEFCTSANEIADTTMSWRPRNIADEEKCSESRFGARVRFDPNPTVVSIVKNDKQDSHGDNVHSTLETAETRTRNQEPARCNPVSHASKSHLKLPEYDGAYEASIFLRQLDSVSELNNWTDQEVCAHLLTSLKGPARDILSCFPSDVNITTQKLRKALKDKFGRKVQSDVARLKLSEFRQGRGQNLRQLGFEIEKLITQAYGQVDGPTRNTLSVDAFLNAITDSEVKLQVRLRQPKDLAEAIQQAESTESALRQARGLAANRRAWVNAAVEEDTDWEGEFKQAPKRQVQKPEAMNKQFPNKVSLKCQICYLGGHVAKDCYHRYRDSAFGQRQDNFFRPANPHFNSSRQNDTGRNFSYDRPQQNSQDHRQANGALQGNGTPLGPQGQSQRQGSGPQQK
jgi:hypothetical protein